ncbi:MAG: DUF4190 domain-containing protein [Suilimivivens sp.]
MSEENGLIYCSQCGSSNPSTFKFCSNCGAKLEQPQNSVFDQQPQNTAPVYERAEAEIVSEGEIPLTQDELNINYDAEESGDYSSGSYASGNYSASSPQYYSASNGNNSNVTAGSNGNSGFAIASMVCGIISLICCCLSWFSLVLGIAAVVLGVIALKHKYDGKGMAIAGIVTGGIGIFIWLIVMLVAGSGFFTSLVEELSYY